MMVASVPSATSPRFFFGASNAAFQVEGSPEPSDWKEWTHTRYPDGKPHISDETNADVSIPRNRIRAELLPLLVDRFNPGIIDVLADQAELARDAAAWIDAAAAELDTRSVRRSTLADGSPVCTIDVDRLCAAPLALRRALVWGVMREIAGRRPIAFGHVDAALRLIDEHADTRVDFPGQRLERIGGAVVLTGRVAGAEGRGGGRGEGDGAPRPLVGGPLPRTQVERDVGPAPVVVQPLERCVRFSVRVGANVRLGAIAGDGFAGDRAGRAPRLEH